MSVLADNCKRLRSANGWSQADAHRELGFSVKMYEAGHRRRPCEAHLETMSRVFGVSESDLLFKRNLRPRRKRSA